MEKVIDQNESRGLDMRNQTVQTLYDNHVQLISGSYWAPLTMDLVYLILFI